MGLQEGGNVRKQKLNLEMTGEDGLHWGLDNHCDSKEDKNRCKEYKCSNIKWNPFVILSLFSMKWQLRLLY